MSTSTSANPENVNSWFESLANEALDRNTKSVCTWSKYKDDLEQTKNILSWLPNKLKHDVMVPIGPRALMRGKIVHTNELLVNLGETWFVKTTAKNTIEICNRRIGKCEEMLEKLKKEEELLQNKKSLPQEKEAFGNEERPEIVEYVSEEEHQEWRKQHREKEKEYRRQLAEIRNKEKKPIESEEDLWNKLDELELREELEDELYRLNADDGNPDDYDYDDDDDDDDAEYGDYGDDLSENPEDSSATISQCDNKIDERTKCLNSGDTSERAKGQGRSVSFIEATDDEPLRLEIKHSEVDVSQGVFTGFINSPSDIYEAYKRTLNPKSILKNSVNINKEKELNSIRDDDHDHDHDQDEVADIPVISGIILPDVVSKEFPIKDEIELFKNVGHLKEPTRRISKFKASRMKKS